MAAAHASAVELAYEEWVTTAAAALRTPQQILCGLFAEARDELEAGRVPRALVVLDTARTIAESPGGTDADRAELFFLLGCCRLTDGSAPNAAALLTLALDFADRSALTSDALRTDILDWRSRCYQRQRDWQAARADVERALELAHHLGDSRVTARVCMQASIVAEREKQWHLARFYAEEARDLLQELGDDVGRGKVLNNLGGIHFLLGDVASAMSCLADAFELASSAGRDIDAGYAISSLAQVRLRTGEYDAAATDARRALDLLDGRTDHANEVASAELVLAGALLELGDADGARSACERAETVLDDYGSASHSAAAWISAGDIARRSGDVDHAADLYRRAAEALQDLNF